MPSQTVPWRPGDRIHVRGAAWTVVRRTLFTGCETLRIASARNGSRTLLLPFDRPRAAGVRTHRVVRIRNWMHRVREVLADCHPYGGLRFCPPGIRLLPYQFEPAIAMLRDGCARVLIADGVGLGKTVQAGLILCELSHASETCRALILTPAGLRDQWHAELVRHFAIASRIADAHWLRSALREMPADVNPWSLPGIYIASFDFVKRPEALRPLEDVRWDLLVVDEAHAAAIGTDRRAAVDAIASRARRVVLLTATPHPGDPEQFAALCGIGATSQSPPPAFFQRRRAPAVSASGSAPRRSTLIAVRLHPTEERMHRLLDAYTTRVWEEPRRESGHAHLAAIVLRKRALSSARSLAVSVRRRIDLLAGTETAPTQLTLPIGEDEDPLEDAPPDAAIARPALGDPELERRLLADVAEAAGRAAAHESKLRVLHRLLARIREPVIVFTEYRDTLERLCASIAETGRPVTVVHGGMSPRERSEAVALFNRSGRTMLATDAASEGLNLQESCRIVLHYELPWNPSRMEQRAGRVDRIGQVRRVHEIGLVASDTAESLVLRPLVRRAAGWNGREGLALRLTESRVADMLIGGLPIEQVEAPWAAPPVLSMDCHEAAGAEAARLHEHRRLATRARGSARDTFIPVCVWSRPAPHACGVALIFRLAILDGTDSAVHTESIAVHLRCAVPRTLRTASDVKTWTRALLPVAEPTAAARVHELARKRLSALRPGFARAVAAARGRESELAAAIPSAAKRLVQAGLFDRRAVSAAEAQVRATTALRDDTQAAMDALDGSGRLTSSVELRAVLVMNGPSRDSG